MPGRPLEFSSDGRLLVARRLDRQSVAIADVEAGRERLAIYLLDGGESWLLVTPKGRHEAGGRGADVLRLCDEGRRSWVPASDFPEAKRLRSTGLLAEALSIDRPQPEKTS